VSTSPSTSKWKPFDGSFTSIAGTTELVDLPRDQWPGWARDGNQFNRIGACALPPGVSLGTTVPTTGVVGALLTERLDPKDHPEIYNYNFYLVAETTDGRLYQSPPIVPRDPKHHSSSSSTWFNSLGRPTAV
jgi:hypothetical protein